MHTERERLQLQQELGPGRCLWHRRSTAVETTSLAGSLLLAQRSRAGRAARRGAHADDAPAADDDAAAPAADGDAAAAPAADGHAAAAAGADGHAAAAPAADGHAAAAAAAAAVPRASSGAQRA